jgi:cytochrome P450
MMRLAKLSPVSLRGPRPVPLFGTMGSFFRFFGDPVAQLLAVHRDHGALATLADRDPAVIFAFSPESNRTVLHDAVKFTNEADLPVPVPPDSSPTRLNNALTSMNGELHRRHRRLMMPVFSRAGVERHAPDMVAVTESFLGRFHPGATVDVAHEMVQLTLHLAMKCLFGLDAGGEAEALGRLGLGYLTGLTSPAAMLFPFRIPGTPYRRFLDTSDELERRVRALIAARRAQPTGRDDVLSILIRAHDDESGAGLTDSELVGHAAVLFIAGHETTAFTLAWTLFLLAQHPEVMRALVGELDAVLAGAPPTAAQLGSLPCLDRVVKESMRLLPATAFLFFRRATEAFSLEGHELPAGAITIHSALITHRFPDLYPEPRRFLPDRWKDLAPAPYAYLPFGAGPRTCIGMTFAAQAIRVVLATMLQRFGFALVPGAGISRKVQGITLGAKHGVPMRLLRRGERGPVVKVTGDIGDLVELPRA